jgi:hypothetical protein
VEVDRIWRIDGLDRNANPSWQNSTRRRRRFVEEVPAGEDEPETGDEQAEAEDPLPEPDDRNLAGADDEDSPAGSGDSQATFKVVA